MTLPTLIAKLEEADRKWRESGFREDDALPLAHLFSNSLPTLIEAVKRQGEALELVQQNVEASASSYQERVETIGRVVRAALKETTDV